LETINSNNRYI